MANRKTQSKRPARRQAAKATKKKATHRASASAVKSPKMGGKAATPDRPAKEKSQHPHASAIAELRAFGLTYPEAHTKSPWPGHLDLAVRDKIFAHLTPEGEDLTISCKLPNSCDNALALEFAEPTGYGLGKSGWVTASFPESATPPVEFLKAWIDESYRAIAPKTLVKRLATE